MAMLFVEFMTKDEIKAAFDKARADGKSHLLFLEESSVDVLAIRDDNYVLPVNSIDEVVEVLRARNADRYYGISTQLKAIYDVAQDFDVQQSFSKAAGATAPAFYFLPKQTAADLRAELESYYEERNHKWAVQSWEAQPWFKKMFSKPPEAPQSLQASQPSEPANA